METAQKVLRDLGGKQFIEKNGAGSVSAHGDTIVVNFSPAAAINFHKARITSTPRGYDVEFLRQSRNDKLEVVESLTAIPDLLLRKRFMDSHLRGIDRDRD